MEFFIKKAKARAEVYRLLSQAFYDPKILDNAFALKLEEAFQALGIYLFKEALEALKLGIESINTTELSVEYCKLFFGPAKLLAPPYESVYLEGRVMGESTVDVVKSYEKAGISISQNFKNLPDHAAAELEFMYYLCSKELEAWEKKDIHGVFHYLVLQKSFLKEHLMKWIPQFCELIKKNASSEFYRSLAKIAEGYINIEGIEKETVKELAYVISLLNLMGQP